MKAFKIPRKLKKKLKKGLWLYPSDEKTGGSLMASPARNKEDLEAYKSGELRNLLNDNRSKQERKEENSKLDKENYVSDQTLRKYIDDIIRKDLRTSSFHILREAKNSKKAVRAYFNFVNAYELFESGEESYGNICCLAIDHAKKLLR